MLDFNPIGQGLEPIGNAWNAEDVTKLMADEGFTAAKRKRSLAHERRVTEAARLLANVMDGSEDPVFWHEAMNPSRPYLVAHLQEHYPGIGINLRETMSYSDYSALTADILDRMLYGYYTEAPITNLPLVKQVTLRDFRLVARYATDYATKPWSRMPETDTTLTPSGEGEPATERAMQQTARQVAGSTQRVTYQPQAYQGLMSVNWRALVNDDLGIFQDMVQRLSIGGRRTVYQYITRMYVSSTGPNTTLYSATFRNLVTTTYGAATNNPPLSFQGLIDAITVLERQLDLDGQPITFDGQLYLWYPPSLEMTAQALLSSQVADISVGGGTTNVQGFPSQRLRVDTAYVLRNMKGIQDKYIPIVCTTGTIGNTMWGLTYAPASQARPSLELGFLKGFETPQLFQKVPNTMRVGGGVDPMLGDFYSMNQTYKGIIVMGGTQVDGRSTVVSNGQ